MTESAPHTLPFHPHVRDGGSVTLTSRVFERPAIGIGCGARMQSRHVST